MKRTTVLLLVVLSLAGCKTRRNRVERVVDTALTPPSVEREQHQGPDLSFLHLKWAKLGLAAGESSTVELDLVNRGTVAAGPFRVAVWVCTDNAITANKQLAGSVEVGGLPVGNPQRQVITFVAPTEKRGYAIAIEVDDRKQVEGDDRRNNASGVERLWVR